MNAADKPLDDRRFEGLIGKVAIVTGASRGIGAEAARELAHHGVSVLLLARTVAQIESVANGIRAEGGQAVALSCNVARHADLEAAIAHALKIFGRIDILVNNAGVIEPIARLADSDPLAWDQAVDINLKGVYHGIRAALPPMLVQGGGTIINISSGAATGALEG